MGMKIKVSEATPLQLDWLVVKIQANINDYSGWVYKASINEVTKGNCHPSTDWSQGGPIIEQEFISLDPFEDSPRWCAKMPCSPYNYHGPTPLIAAMRCFCASRLGDEVEIPEELTS